MDELIRHLAMTLRGMWRRRWIGLAAAWLVAVLGGVALFQMPDRYEANARVFVDTQSILRPLMSGLAIQPDVEQQLAMLSRTFVSRSNIEKVIQMAGLDSTIATPGERERLIAALMRSVQVRGGGRENLYTIAYRNTSPVEAQRVVQALLAIFVSSKPGDTRQDSDAARRFIEEQIKAYEIKLQEAENRLKEFRLKQLAQMGPDGGDYFARMTALGDGLDAARLELRAAEQSRGALKRELAAEDPGVFLPDVRVGGPAAAPSDIDARIESQKRALDELTRKYTDRHPDVLGTRRVLEELEAQKRQELESRKQAVTGGKAPPMVAATNPVFQQLKIALAEAEANVASLQARASELETRYRQLQASAKLRPQIDAEFARLNRDYEVQKRSYEALVGRRESAELTTQMGAAAGVGEFRIVDPPSVPQTPVAPNRLLLLPLVFLAAVAAGVFTSFAVSQILPTFHETAALRQITQRPVLGAVTLRPRPATISRKRRNAALFAGGLAGLASAFGGAMVLVWLRIGVA